MNDGMNEADLIKWIHLWMVQNLRFPIDLAGFWVIRIPSANGNFDESKLLIIGTVDPVLKEG